MPCSSHKALAFHSNLVCLSPPPKTMTLSPEASSTSEIPSVTSVKHDNDVVLAPLQAPDGTDNGATIDDEVVYQYLVVDSGPVIRLTGTSVLWKKARTFYTVPAVIQEIRDAKAREHLDQLPFDLIPREPSISGLQAVANFARQTGDIHSLSSVDLQVLGLLYDLEREGCMGDMSHIRTIPKRVLGLGQIQVLGGGNQLSSSTTGETVDLIDEGDIVEYGSDESSDDESSVDDGDDEDTEQDLVKVEESATAMAVPKGTSWVKIVDPSAKDAVARQEAHGSHTVPAVDASSIHSMFGKMRLAQTNKNDLNGQFSDAEDDPLLPTEESAKSSIEAELELDFPSLTAAATVPYCDEEGQTDNLDTTHDPEKRLAIQRNEEEEARKQQSLRPISKSGMLYNSFRKYGDLMKPKQQQRKLNAESVDDIPKVLGSEDQASELPEGADQPSSRIIGGTTLAGQELDVEDDGEGWITSTSEIRVMKANGALEPGKQGGEGASNVPIPAGPPASQRAACATTDFAMQNVILQMNLELLSVDGIKVRKLKSFVTRCGACFKVYTSQENTGPLNRRLFCDKCGSDMMQRIAASVDGKTGRLRLHLSRRYKHNLRGTKFSLPKPGTGDRFKGDLLLREDQLLMGAWNQKVKMSSGGKARASAESIFGRDLASTVGCKATASSDDIRVGFGRRNPNAAKGRERRGKKKKTTEKACGLRRY